MSKKVEVRWENSGTDDAEMYCGNCDVNLFEEWNYCPMCGAELLIHGQNIQ